MEKRFNGYIPKSIKTARAQRMLNARAQLLRARSHTAVLLAVVLLVIIGISALLVLRGRFVDNMPLIIAMLAVFAGFVVLSVLFFAICHAIYGNEPESQRVGRILHRYLCGLLGDTYRAYEREIVGRDSEQLIKHYALEYITDFHLLKGEREKLLAEGALEAEGEVIRRRYEDFITYVISDDRAAERYIALRRNMAKALEKWRHHNLPRYDKPQRAIIESNIRRITRMATDEYERFLSQYGVREYILLMNDVIYYNITEEKALWKPLPIKKKYQAFCTVVKTIEESDPGKMIGAGRSGVIFDYGLALESYRQFTKTYATAACPQIKEDIAVYEEEFAAAKQAQETCWKCGEKYHPRFRRIGERCKHYICNRCDVCYCSSPQSRRRRSRHGSVRYPHTPAEWWEI